MRKTFTTILPDEPYKTATTKNITVECTYDGPRYMLLRIRESDGFIFSIDRLEDELAEIEKFRIEPHKLQDEGMYQVLLDAMENTWEAAHLTGNYTHEPFADYVETLPTGETYTYHYDDESCAVEQPYYVNDMHYDKGTNTYKRPRRRVHAVSKADFAASIAGNLKHVQEMLDEQSEKFTAEDLVAIREYRDFLASVPTKYIAAGVDHWKIPFPPIPKLSS